MARLTFAFSMARRNMGRRRFRWALTILGIIVAVTTMVSVSMILFGLQQEVTKIVNEIVGPNLVVQSGQGLSPELPPTAPEIPEFVSYILDRIPGIEGAYPVWSLPLTSMVIPV